MVGLARRLAGVAGTCALILLAGCSGGGGGGSGSAAAPTVTLTADPTSIDQGDSAELTWSSTNATSCTASGGWSGSRGTSGTAASGPLSGTTTFNLSCTGSGGTAETTVTVTVDGAPPDDATISGNVRFQDVPHGAPGTGLNYAAQSFVTMTAEVLVEALDASTDAVLASGRFAGDYELSVPSQTNITVRVTAEMLRDTSRPPPRWHVIVRDLDAFGTPLGPIHSYTSPAFDSGSGGIHHINIPSGWNASGQLVGPRSAAPFAILDDIGRAIQTVIDVDPTVNSFPELNVDWGPDNVGGETFFSHDPNGTRRIVLSGEVDVDTEEYDPHVVLHEFGHYLDDAFSRSDSIGGSHSFGDVLDMRVALGEGLATVLGAIVLDDSAYRDSFGFGQGDASYFDIEDDETFREGWYSEDSVMELGWDLYDSASDAGDNVALGLAPIWEVMRGPERTTDAATSVFSFATYLKQARPAAAAAIATLLAGEQIVGSTIDEFGTTETNDAGSSDVLPVYTPIDLGQTVNVRSTAEFGTYNALSNHRFVLLTLDQQMSVRFAVSAASSRDPDIAIFHKGTFLGPENLGPENEDFTMTVGPGELVLDVYDCGNADCNFEVPPAPTQITISVTPN